MTLFQLATRFVGEITERTAGDHPFIVWALELCGLPHAADEVPWCSAFVNACAWILRLPRSKSAAARSWLLVGIPVTVLTAIPASDVVILSRGVGPQPGPEVLAAPGHVGLFAGLEGAGTPEAVVLVLGGNQGNGVSLARFPVAHVLGVRRLA